MDNDIAVLSKAKREVLAALVAYGRPTLGTLAKALDRTINSVQNDLLDMVDQGIADFEKAPQDPAFKRRGKTAGGKKWYATPDGQQVLDILETRISRQHPYTLLVVWVRPTEVN